MSLKRYADVAVALPVSGLFSYEVPPGLGDCVRIGSRVLVPFGKRTITGYVVALTGTPGVETTKPVIDVLDDCPIFDQKKLEFFRWLAGYYFAPLGEVLALAHPASVNVSDHRYFTLTEPGRRRLEEDSPKDSPKIPPGNTKTRVNTQMKILIAVARGGATMAALRRRLRGAPIHSAIETLKARGLMVEETRLGSATRHKVEKRFTLAGGLDTGKVLSGLSSAPLQASVVSHVDRNKESSAVELVRRFGVGARGAAKALVSKGILVESEKVVIRDPAAELLPRAQAHEPTPEQKIAIDAICGEVSKGRKRFSPFLLHGVTASGKTFVYLNAIDAAIKAGKGVIVLVPEIALTSRIVQFVTERHAGRVAVMHSSLGEGERHDQWRRILGGEADIVIGARSALFAPIKDPGLIIVDEEHETSYKQEDGIRYHARDSALMLGKFLDATVVLGSATPSVETFHNARTGKLTLLKMTGRVGGGAMPEVEVLDVRGRGSRACVISERLKELLDETLSKGRQALLMLNRRGYSSYVICTDCGATPECPNCSVTLTMHKGDGLMKCHYCDFSTPLPSACPSCKSANLRDPGMGTEKVEAEVKRIFPDARTCRMDSDTTRRKGAASKLIDAMESGEVDILIGTQMASKGHHFPQVTFAGIISADTSLNIPDFRGSERTFQLITQTAGRAGRGKDKAKVLVQTYNPEHSCFTRAAAHDYSGFFTDEIEFRREAAYPPFVRLCVLRVEGRDRNRVMRAAGRLKTAADRLSRAGGAKGRATVVGPTPALVERLKGRYRWQLLVKGPDPASLHRAVSAIKASFDRSPAPGVRLIIDVDPITTV